MAQDRWLERCSDVLIEQNEIADELNLRGHIPFSRTWFGPFFNYTEANTSWLQAIFARVCSSAYLTNKRWSKVQVEL